MKRLIIFVMTFALSYTSFSQSKNTIGSIRDLTDSIEKLIINEHITGLMLGITTKDSIIFSGGFGYADIDKHRKVDQHTLFRLGSVTKMFVSLGIMKLVHEGKLNLNDEISKIASDIPLQNKWESTHPLKLVHLLEHTSGFDDIKLNRMYSTDTNENKGIDMMLVHKPSMICRWRPGERQSYSNPNYAILGYIIQKITGMPYERYLTETILQPLGMTQSNFNLHSHYPEQDVKEYIFRNGQTIQVPGVTLLSGPQGALWSNANEMVKFLQLFLRNGAPLVTKETIDEIETTHSLLNSTIRLKSTYALGNTSANINGKYLWRGHDGLTGTCYSDCFYNRDLNIGFVISSNSNNNHYAIWKLIISYLEQDKPVIPLHEVTMDKNSVEPYMGYYEFKSPRNEISGFKDKLLNLVKIEWINGKLLFNPIIGESTEIIQTAPMTFAFKGDNSAQIVFTKNSVGKICMMINGSYYEKTSTAWAIGKRLIAIISIVLLLSYIGYGIIALIQFSLKKIRLFDFIMRILPIVGIGFFGWALSYLLEVQKYTYKMYELGTINQITIIIFLGTSLFGIISIMNLLYTFSLIKRVKRWLFCYLLLAGLSMFIISLFLHQNEWIGLRTWAL